MGHAENHLLVHVPILFYVILKYIKAQNTLNFKIYLKACRAKYSPEKKFSNKICRDQVDTYVANYKTF